MTSRLVCNMSPEDVEKKRQIDRDNQRHFRNKRKVHIQGLEKEILELKRELDEARVLLARKPICSACGSIATTSIAPDAQLATPSPTTSPPTAAELSEPQDLSAFPWENTPVDLAQGFTINLFGTGPESQYLDINLENIPDLPPIDSIPDGSPPGTSEGKHPWELMPLHLAPSTRLDRAIESISTMARKLLLKRKHLSDELNQPSFPSISSLLNPSADSDSLRPVSSAVAAHVWTSPVNSTTGRIAFMYILSYLLRWLICQDERSYNQLPRFLRPTQLQCTVPHPAWIDTIVWPDMRDIIIKWMNWGQFEEYRNLSSTTLSVNWQFTDSGAFLESADGQNLVLNPLFESHIRKLENWTIGPEVGEEFPFLAPWCSCRSTRARTEQQWS